MYKPRLTKNFIRQRVENPKHFSIFRTIKQESGNEIIIGKRKHSKKWGIQAVLHKR